jgi:hypothetical protein
MVKITAFVRSHVGLVLGALVFLAYVLSHVQIYDANQNLRGSALETLALANSIAFKGAFADPFDTMPTGPTAHLAPIYPAILAVILRVFTDGPAGVFAVKWFTISVVALQAALMPALGIRMRLGYLPGLLAGLAIVVGSYESFLWEANLAGLLVTILAFAITDQAEEVNSKRKSVLQGVLWGITLLVSPVVLAVFIPWLIWGTHSGRFKMSRAVLIFGIALSVTFPWILRTKRALHHFVFVRDNLGLEMAQFYSPCSGFSGYLVRAADCRAGPNGKVDEAKLLVHMGEVEYNGYKLREALRWIGSNRSKAAVLTLQRIGAFWFPTETGRLRDATAGEVILGISTVLAIPGMWLLFKTHQTLACTVVIWMAFFPLVYYLIDQGDRSRYPILWVTLLPAAYAICCFLGEAKQSLRI